MVNGCVGRYVIQGRGTCILDWANRMKDKFVEVDGILTTVGSQNNSLQIFNRTIFRDGRGNTFRVLS